jgi:hypothetical protein
MLPAADCACPDRCIPKACALCKRGVHYDPAASIPLLGEEMIVCDRCIENRWLKVEAALSEEI